jgi:uncharacterized damage-inducible protein DinB
MLDRFLWRNADMDAATAQRLVAYDEWAMQRAWACIQTLNEQDFIADTGYSFGSVRNQLVHLVSVEKRWYARMMDAEVPDRLRMDDFETQAEIGALLQAWTVQRQAIVAGWTDDAMRRSVAFALAHRQIETTLPLHLVFLHTLNHNTDHRAQIFATLHRLNAPTAEHDLILFLGEA